MKNTRKIKKEKAKQPNYLTQISIKGYKSIAKKCSIDICPITIIGGANSSGKSSIMQPLLLMKQTLDSFSDPGVLKINGPHVYFTNMDQLFSHVKEVKTKQSSFEVEMKIGDFLIKNIFMLGAKDKLKLQATCFSGPNQEYKLTPRMKKEKIFKTLPRKLVDSLQKTYGRNFKVKVVLDRCFYGIEFSSIEDDKMSLPSFPVGEYLRFAHLVSQIIHLPALRGNPERSYPTAVLPQWDAPGIFSDYVAGTIKKWQDDKDEKLKFLIDNLREIGLVDRIVVEEINDTEVMLKVGRLWGKTGKEDLVNIADVGFGISQILPIAVALVAARSGQLVYIEQPEIHLHPKAQYKLAHLFVEAVQRDVRMVIETHSNILILALQTMMAKKKLKPEDVALHWFERDAKGVTSVKKGSMDQSGSYDDWPEDFCDTELEAENEFLNAVEIKH